MLIRRFNRSERHVLAVLTLAGTTALAIAAPGCSDDTPATPRVTLSADVAKGNFTTAECPDSNPAFLTIGSFGNPAATPAEQVNPIDDGATDQQGVVSVTCSVVPTNDGFTVKATTSLSGATGGAFRVEGFFKPAQDNSNIDISLSHLGTTYAQKNCTASFTEPLQTVAAGRVWAVVTCDSAAAPSLQRTCKTTTQFRFENCGQ
ncbi:hypothetical protein AKJ09_06624 [Labilithrix luteola]|uniref:Lipoprotein n=1 Tax=Labilithrix luteola TaxID=1391654 RepID=A0A0K1Q2C1_9BACT|nr:hypothetical protein [Labilithrix luteola]AKU99960.1 hypothetical protein AKJ09_06624 [Labilithrix luteola]